MVISKRYNYKKAMLSQGNRAMPLSILIDINSQLGKSRVNEKLKISLNIFGREHCPQPILLRIMNIQAIQSQPRSYISGSVERRQGIK